MNAVEIIIKKRDKKILSREEIDFFINGFTKGFIPDYQASAWLMAILLNGMTDQEVTDLTMAMAYSGDIIDKSKNKGISVDKHSTGGVGDKTSLVVLPIVVSCGLHVGKMSGRGLGYSGGTLDKLESIPGYRCQLTPEEFEKQLEEIGIVLAGQSQNLAPADGKLYALRDVTGTVPSIPLIASSIMSKKIAAGSQAILLDVKVGLGAFMKTMEEARKLADTMVSIGNLAGKKVVALLSDMNQPLGRSVGNSLEVKEAIETLSDEGSPDFREHCLIVSSRMLLLGEVARSLPEARKLAEESLASKKAFNKFRQLVQAQGGDTTYLEDPSKFKSASLIDHQKSLHNGYICELHAGRIGKAAVLLGAGRMKKEDHIDPSVGIEVLKKVGDKIEIGETILTIHANDGKCLANAKRVLSHSIRIQEIPCPALPLFYT